jgi:probable rRNA maturation factor
MGSGYGQVTSMEKPNPAPHLPVRIARSFDAEGWPSKSRLSKLVREAVAAATLEIGFSDTKPKPELSVVFTDDAAIRVLNARWRGMEKPTNVLSFPATSWDGTGDPPKLLGDIVMALETIRREAAEQGKTFDNHLAHLVIHGFLHLVGFDHQADEEAERMEAVERHALARLAIPDPYAVSDSDG